MNIIPSGDALGAEVRGVDLSAPLDADALERAWSDHLVLLFRGQKLADEDLLALAEAMGGTQEAGSRSYYIKGGYGVETGRVSRLPGISIVSNLDESGKPAKHHAGTGSQELTWHTDNSYVEQPPKGSILYAHKVPVNGGGDTSFANQYVACERLPEATRSRLPGLTVRHDSSRNTAGGLRPTVAAPASRGEVPGPVHPLLRRHPVTGRTAALSGAPLQGAVEPYRRTRRGGERSAAGRALGGGDPSRDRLDACLAAGRRADLGQPLHAPRPHGGRSDPAARVAPDAHPRRAAAGGLTPAPRPAATPEPEPVDNNPSFAVVGAGMVGTCCALYLQKEGFDVTLVDRGGPGEEASFGNLGGFGVASCPPAAMPGILRKAPGMLLDADAPLKLPLEPCGQGLALVPALRRQCPPGPGRGERRRPAEPARQGA